MQRRADRFCPELLAPAGDEEKLAAALHFGADAVYLAGERLGMRKASKNFKDEQLVCAVTKAHGQGVRVYVTLNILPHDADFEGLVDYVRFLEQIGVDAVIVSDPGVFSVVRENTNLDIHLSTQASVTNAATVRFWHRQGAKRIVLARELSIEEIRRIRHAIDPEIELEVFVHGAMCISYSGRCLLSNYLTGRDANQGDCAQACRWKYHLMEESRPGEFFPIGEDEHGTYIMNSKDLCLLPELEELIEAGVTSFKIEGRVKTQYYVATVVHAYRRALNALREGRWSERVVQQCMEELRKVSHRDFTKGFYYGRPTDAQNTATGGYLRTHEFVGAVLSYDAQSGRALIEERNPIRVGDSLEFFGRAIDGFAAEVEGITLESGEEVEQIARPRTRFFLSLPQAVEAGDLVRRAITGKEEENDGLV